MKEQESATEIKYRSITYILSLLIIIAVFISPKNQLIKEIFDFSFNLLALSIFWFGYLWQKRQSILLALFIASFSWNIDLLVYPLFQTKNEMILNFNLFQYNRALHVFAYFFFITGLLNWIKIKFLDFLARIEIETLAISLFGFAVIFQTIFRI